MHIALSFMDLTSRVLAFQGGEVKKNHKGEMCVLGLLEQVDFEHL